jgi:hypothetical protein
VAASSTYGELSEILSEGTGSSSLNDRLSNLYLSGCPQLCTQAPNSSDLSEFNFFGINSAQPLFIRDPILQNEATEVTSVMSGSTNQNNRKRQKAWSKQEEEELVQIMRSNPPTNISDNEWIDISQRFDRSVCSIYTKAKNLMKKVKIEEKSTKTTAKHIPAENPPTGEKGNSNYELISSALDRMEGNMGTKKDIFQMIERIVGQKNRKISREIFIPSPFQ